MTFFISKRIFESYSLPYQHKKASMLLMKAVSGHAPSLHDYRHVEAWLLLPSLDIINIKAVADRYHYHLLEAKESLKEHNFPFEITKYDAPSDAHFLPIAIYLDNLRSAFNVGSILRTTEAFRLGTLYFGERTPFIDNPKVQKTAMGTHDKVPSFQANSFENLPRPIIGMETIKVAPLIYDFEFPESFTLILGNEEYGLGEMSLKACDHFVQIPLVGFKNSLNVSCAYAIAASEIRRQHSLKSAIAAMDNK